MSSRHRDVDAVGASVGIDDEEVCVAGAGVDEGASVAVGRGGVGGGGYAGEVEGGVGGLAEGRVGGGGSGDGGVVALG